MKQRSIRHAADATMELSNALQELNQNSIVYASPQFVSQSYSSSTAGYPAAQLRQMQLEQQQQYEQLQYAQAQNNSFYAMDGHEAAYAPQYNANYIAQQQQIDGFSDTLTSIPQQIALNDNEYENDQMSADEAQSANAIIKKKQNLKATTKNTQKLLQKYGTPTPLDTEMANDDASFGKKLAMLDQASDEVENEDDAEQNETEQHNQRYSTMSIGSDQSDHYSSAFAQRRARSAHSNQMVVTPILQPISSKNVFEEDEDEPMATHQHTSLQRVVSTASSIGFEQISYRPHKRPSQEDEDEDELSMSWEES